MSRRAHVSAAGLALAGLAHGGLALLDGCRAVLGIDDLVVVDAGDGSEAGATGGGDSGRDAVAGDGGPASGGDGGRSDSGPPLTDVSACVTSGDCRQCCRQTYGARFGELEKLGRATGCICGAGLCAADCASSACKSAPTMPEMGVCGQCVDDALSSSAPACAQARAQCQSQGDACEPAATCLAACPAR